MTDATTTEQQRTVPLSSIKPGANPRRYFSPAKHDELVASLRLRGVLQPILLRPAAEPDTYLLVAGGRRFRAAVEVFGQDGDIPAVVREMTDQEALEAAIDENDVRDDTSETEQADAAVRVLTACGGDRVEAAKRLGWSNGKFDTRMALAGLSDAVKAALDERRIKIGHAELLAAVPADKQDKALETVLTSGIDVIKTRELLQRMTQSLGAAIFDKTECTACPFNSGLQRALFENHVDDGHCTNGACFALKTETAEKAKAAAAPPPAPVGSAAKPAVSPAPAKPAAIPSKIKVTAQGLADKLAPTRKRGWRNAVATALRGSGEHERIAEIAALLVTSGGSVGDEQVAALADEFEVDLRQTWCVDGTFLALLSKDEVKFVAQECGLVAHMGEKAFAKLLAVPVSDLISGILHATGFDWAGRLPGAMTLDGQYGLPPGTDTTAAAATIED